MDLSLQNISRKIRHTIAKEYYFDVDIKNAHPTLLEWYCEQKGLKHTSLSDYIDNRDAYLELLQEEKQWDRYTAKNF